MSLKNLYKKYTRDEHAKEIIISIAKVGFILGITIFAPNAAAQILKMLGFIPDYKSRTRTERTLKSLKRRGLLSFKIKNGKTTIKLTEKGKLYYKRLSIESIKLPKYKNWDNVWNILTFDIPESERINRKHFSKTLSILGMYNLEKSIFVYPYECHKELLEIAEVFLVSKYVHYIRATYVQNDGSAKKFFKLN